VRGEIVAFILGVLFLALMGRLYRIQQINEDYYQVLAGKQHRGVEYLEPTRGRVYTSDGQVLASSLLVDSVYVDSQFVGKAPQTAKVLQEALCLSPARAEELRKRIEEGKRFIWVKRKISEKEEEILRRLDIPGVFFVKEHKRHYPEAACAAHIVGFCNVDDEGLAGVESVYDEYLVGQRGMREFERDALGHRITKPGMYDLPKVDGSHIYLTIDSVIQHIVEKALDDAYEEWEPLWAAAIVLNVRNGEVLGMACRPTFDPNKPHLYSEKRRRNYAITDMYEPGSTFKPITFSGLFEQNLVTPDEKVFCENGMWKAGRRRLRDHRPHGWLTVNGVIALSSNIGTAKCAQKMLNETFDSYMRRYGFSTHTGIDLPGEAQGFLANVNDWSGYSLVSLAMGQEINVTAMQIVTAFSAIASGGELHRPHVLKKVVDQDGNVIGRTESDLVRRVISKETSHKLTEAMTEVVETGTAPRAQSKLYMIAGKTGTAQKKLEGARGYADNKYVASFCGFAPVSRPRICVLVVVNEPHGWSYFGGTVAGPPAREIIEQTLIYMRIPADRKTEDAGTVSQNTQSQGTANR